LVKYMYFAVANVQKCKYVLDSLKSKNNYPHRLEHNHEDNQGEHHRDQWYKSVGVAGAVDSCRLRS